MSVKVVHHVAPNSSGVRTVYASVRYPYGSPPDEIEIAGTAYARENAKLRKLVRILAYCMSEDRDCDRCTLNGADMPTPIISACDSLPDRIRELGIEVD